MARYDVIVIGAGHNGLTTACLLARAGRRVLVLERRDIAGGMCASEEFHPGYRTPGLLHDTLQVRAGVVEALRLDQHGLDLVPPPATLLAGPDGRGVSIHASTDATAADIAQTSARDAERWREYRAFIARARKVIEPLAQRRRPPTSAPSAACRAGRWARSSRARCPSSGSAARDGGAPARPAHVRRRLAERMVRERSASGPVSRTARSSACGPVRGRRERPPTCSSRSARPRRSVKGGPRRAGVRAGARGTPPRRGDPDGHGGVVDRGDPVGRRPASCSRPARRIDSGRRRRVVRPAHAVPGPDRGGTLPLRFEHRMGVMRARGTSAKVHLALDAAPGVRGPARRARRARPHRGSLDDLERAFDAVKYRRASERPAARHLCSHRVAARTGAGRRATSVSSWSHFAPYDLAGGWTGAARERLGDAVVAELERVAPGVRWRCVAARC